jgi:AI-2 transport protein TqsA
VARLPSRSTAASAHPADRVTARTVSTRSVKKSIVAAGSRTAMPARGPRENAQLRGPNGSDIMTRRLFDQSRTGAVSAPETKKPAKAPTRVLAPPLFGVLVLAGLVIAGAGLQATSNIVGPVFLVLTLVIAVHPLRVWMVHRHVPEVISSVVALLAVYALLVIVLGSIVWSLTQLVTALTEYSAAFTDLYNQGLGALARVGISSSTLQTALASVNLATFAGVAQTLLNTLTSGLSSLALMLATAFFLVFDAAGVDDRIARVAEDRPQIAAGLVDFARVVRRYWVVSTVFGAIVAVLDVTGLAIIGVPMALTWGVLAFVANYIPNVGFFLGLVPPTLIALLDRGVGHAITVVVVYCVINVVIQTLIQPRFTGNAVGMSGTATFLSLIFWAATLGPLGALLAVPATLFVKSLLIDQSASGRWFGALISSTPKAPAQVPARDGR